MYSWKRILIRDIEIRFQIYHIKDQEEHFQIQMIQRLWVTEKQHWHNIWIDFWILQNFLAIWLSMILLNLVFQDKLFISNNNIACLSLCQLFKIDYMWYILKSFFNIYKSECYLLHMKMMMNFIQPRGKKICQIWLSYILERRGE